MLSSIRVNDRLAKQVESCMQLEGDTLTIQGPAAIALSGGRESFVRQYWTGFELTASFEGCSKEVEGNARWLAADICCRLSSDSTVVLTRDEMEQQICG